MSAVPERVRRRPRGCETVFVSWREWRIFQLVDSFQDAILRAPVDLKSGEEVRWQASASRLQGARAVGGNLYLTGQRLLFVPNRFEKLLRSAPWSMPPDQVETIDLDEGGNFIPPKLRVATNAGAQRFLVPEPAAAALSLKNLLQR